MKVKTKKIIMDLVELILDDQEEKVISLFANLDLETSKEILMEFKELEEKLEQKFMTLDEMFGDLDETEKDH